MKIDGDTTPLVPFTSTESVQNLFRILYLVQDLATSFWLLKEQINIFF